jgi:hypothetical protein
MANISETQQLIDVLRREIGLGNVSKAYAVRMRRVPVRIVFQLKNTPADLKLTHMREAAAAAAAKEMLARRTMKYGDLTRHTPRAIRDGIKLLEEKGYAKRAGKGKTAKWV